MRPWFSITVLLLEESRITPPFLIIVLLLLDEPRLTPAEFPIIVLLLDRLSDMSLPFQESEQLLLNSLLSLDD
jgi:hypothetical protein